MESKKTFSLEEAMDAAEKAGINFDESDFTAEDVRKGMNVELEHGSIDQKTNITNDDPVLTAKIAWAHLNESKDYYKFLEKMEEEMES